MWYVSDIYYKPYIPMTENQIKEARDRGLIKNESLRMYMIENMEENHLVDVGTGIDVNGKPYIKVEDSNPDAGEILYSINIDGFKKGDIIQVEGKGDRYKILDDTRETPKYKMCYLNLMDIPIWKKVGEVDYEEE